MTKSKRSGRNYKRKLALGLVNIMLGLAMFAGLYDHLNELLLRFNFQINRNNFLYANWEKIPIALNCRVYLYQIENEADFLKGRKPKLSQHGPFAFKEYRSKRVLSWSQDKSKVEFNDVVRFEPNLEQTAESLDEPLRTANMIFMMTLGLIQNVLRDWNLDFLSSVALNVVSATFKLSGETLFEYRTPREILLGRDVFLFKTLDMISKPLRQLGIQLPGVPVGPRQIKDGRFGMLYLRESNEVGPFEMFTGQDDPARFNTFATAYGKSKLTAYPPPCDRLEGSDGSFFGRNLKPGQSLKLYNPDACRVIDLQFEKVTTFHGARVFEYRFSKDMLDQKTVARNSCYCSRSNRTECHGLIDVSKCFTKAPVAVSYPQFYKAEHLLVNVPDFRPDEELHQSRLFIEPTLGIALSATIRLQINVFVEPFPGLSSLSKLRPMVFPMFWLEEGAQLDPIGARGLAFGVMVMQYGSYGFLILTLLGSIQVRRALKLSKQISLNDNK